jgi:outer membrane murein-binding lipoprotein Lpp
MRSSVVSTLAAPCFAAILGLAAAGCSSPSGVNIELRKQNQSLQGQVDQLTQQHQRDVDALNACQASHPTTRTLTPEQLDQLVTAHGLKIGNLTGGDNPNSLAGADTRLLVYAVPVDENGVPIEAAGSFKIQAFDLDDPNKPLIGTWAFNQNQIKGLFYSQLGLYTYVLACPWQTVPAHPNLTVRVTLDDALTGREFVQQVQCKVRPPGTRP